MYKSKTDYPAITINRICSYEQNESNNIVLQNKIFENP